MLPLGGRVSGSLSPHRSRMPGAGRSHAGHERPGVAKGVDSPRHRPAHDHRHRIRRRADRGRGDEGGGHRVPGEALPHPGAVRSHPEGDQTRRGEVGTSPTACGSRAALVLAHPRRKTSARLDRCRQDQSPDGRRVGLERSHHRGPPRAADAQAGRALARGVDRVGHDQRGGAGRRERQDPPNKPGRAPAVDTLTGRRWRPRPEGGPASIAACAGAEVHRRRRLGSWSGSRCPSRRR